MSTPGVGNAAGGDYLAAKHGFRWGWQNWVPEKNFSDLVQHNRSAALTHYENNRREWVGEHNAGLRFETRYRQQHPASYVHHTHHNNRTWGVVLRDAFGHFWPFGTQTPANAVGSPAYGHNIFGASNGTIPYVPVSHGGSAATWFPYLLGAAALGGTAYYANNRWGTGAAPVPAGELHDPRRLELGESAAFLPIASPQYAGAPEQPVSRVPRQRSQSASF
jgi:hypothetical protein